MFKDNFKSSNKPPLLLVLFGLPGAGKTYVGKILRDEFGFFLYDADADLPNNMRTAINKSHVITDDMRDVFFENVYTRIERLRKQHRKLVVAQTFIKEKYRKLILQNFPNARFILVETETKIREKRLLKRKNFPLNKEYAQTMSRNFETPQIQHNIIDNNKKGGNFIKLQVPVLLEKFLFDHTIKDASRHSAL